MKSVDTFARCQKPAGITLENCEMKHGTITTALPQRELVLMQEYWTRLTGNFVTGRMDVHPSAAKLLNEATFGILETTPASEPPTTQPARTSTYDL